MHQLNGEHVFVHGNHGQTDAIDANAVVNSGVCQNFMRRDLHLPRTRGFDESMDAADFFNDTSEHEFREIVAYVIFCGYYTLHITRVTCKRQWAAE